MLQRSTEVDRVIVLPDVTTPVVAREVADAPSHDGRLSGQPSSHPEGHAPPQPLCVLLVGSSGGHLTQLRALRRWWEQHERLWVTFDTPDATSALADEDVVYGHRPTTRNIPNLLRNTVLAWSILRARRPDVIVSTGAGLALPFFLLGRLYGATTCYIEVIDRIDNASLTGRLCHRISTIFFLQWEEQRQAYPRGVAIGRLL